jgi:hypothetical protein
VPFFVRRFNEVNTTFPEKSTSTTTLNGSENSDQFNLIMFYPLEKSQFEAGYKETSIT